MTLRVLGSRSLAVYGGAEPSWSSKILGSFFWLFGILWQAPAKGLKAAPCTGLCATTARQSRSGALPDGGGALAEPGVPSLAGPRQQDGAPRNTQDRTALSPYLIHKGAKCLGTTQGSGRTPSSCCRVFEGPGAPPTFPRSAQAVRDDTPVGRMIAGQPGPQGNVCASKDRHEAHQFTSHTVEMQQGRPREVGPCTVIGSACHGADSSRGSTIDTPVEVMGTQVTAVQRWKPQPVVHEATPAEEPTRKVGCEDHTVMPCRARMYWQASRNTMGSAQYRRVSCSK